MHRDAGTKPALAGRDRGRQVAVAGTLLVAATYGMARFGVGLFAPQLTADRPGLAAAVGVAAAAQFVSYAVAAGAAFALADRRPRVVLALAGATAVVGCLGVAVARTPAVFVVAVFVGGMGAGFASPAMVRVVDAVVPEQQRPTAQTLVNTGTAVGVVATGLLAFGVTSMLLAWVAMGVTCAVCAVAVLSLARRGATGPDAATPAGDPRTEREGATWSALVEPAVPALLVGAASALIWTFGPTVLTAAGAVGRGQVGWLWIVLGVGGLVGPLTGRVVARLGLRRAWACLAGVLAAANLALSLAVGTGSTGVALVAMGLFGAGYMCLSGVLILWAKDVWPRAAGAATSVLFMLLAVGQAAGSLAADLATEITSPVTVGVAAAVLSVVGAVSYRSVRRRCGPESSASVSKSDDAVRREGDNRFA